MAVVFFVRHFRHYLLGRTFTVRTDHGALRWLFDFKDQEGQVARWLEQLSAYNFNIEHRVGVKHGNDGMSRRPCPDECKTCRKGEIVVVREAKEEAASKEGIVPWCRGRTVRIRAAKDTKLGIEDDFPGIGKVNYKKTNVKMCRRNLQISNTFGPGGPILKRRVDCGITNGN